MNGRTTFYDSVDWQMQQSPRHSVTSSEETRSIFDASPNLTASSHSSEIIPQDEHTTTLTFKPALAISFIKGTSLFKLKYGRLDVCRDAAGGLRYLELSGSSTSHLVHKFPSSRLPIPHLEQPLISGQSPSFRISFLEDQTLQTSGTLFQSKAGYTFERWEECLTFQEVMMGQSVIFCAGLAEAKSKRGEECISQNLRVFKARNGHQTMIIFANSQRKEKRKYISIPLNSIEQIDPGKNSSRPVIMKLSANTDLTASLKTLQVLFLHDSDHMRFLGVLQQGCDPYSR